MTAVGNIELVFRNDRARIGSVVGSGTVGPEPIAEGSSPGTSEIAIVTSFAGCACRASRPPLMRERCLRTVLISPIVGAGAQQRARHRLLVGERNAVGRRDPVGRSAARHQHQHEIVRALRHRRASARDRRPPGRPHPGSGGRPRSCARVASAGRSRGARPRRRSGVRPAIRSWFEIVSLPRLRSSTRPPCRRRAGSSRPAGGGGSSGGRHDAGCAAATAVRNRSARNERRGRFMIRS